MRDLVLTGFMGTGKTTTGRLLAERYGLAFVDTDLEIERRAGRTIAEIFAAGGEETFRHMETGVLQSLMDGEGRVIATGGGALMSPLNRALLGDDRKVICLTCEPDVLESRAMTSNGRPLFNGNDRTAFRRLLAEREPVYSLYPQVDTTSLAPAEVAAAIAHQIDLAHVTSLQMDRRQRSSILLEAGSAGRLGEILRERGIAGRALVVTDEHVAGAGVADTVLASLGAAGMDAALRAIPAGERHKTLATLQELYEVCMRMELDRSATIVGVGGGVIGDVAGMLAATYLRGLRLVLVPTTLVAQVDAAIGGKVGVDLGAAKNLVGAFHPAELVLIDPQTLRTLPPASLADGLAEIVKIAFVRSAPLLDDLSGLSSGDMLAHPAVFRRAAQEKVRVVAEDPYERGERMLLNFGHTIGHGIEAASGYALSHGRAVSIGMAAELALAVDRGWSSSELVPELRALLECFGLPRSSPSLDVDRVMDFIRQDKKRTDGMLRVAVATERGRGAVFPVPEDDVRAAVVSAMVDGQ